MIENTTTRNSTPPTNDFRRKLLPCSTPLPNIFLDHVLPMKGMPDSYVRVFLFIWRKLVGWNRDEDRIPLSQIQRGARVGRRPAVAAVRFWDAAGVFERIVNGSQSATFRINSETVAEQLRHLVPPARSGSRRGETDAPKELTPVSERACGLVPPVHRPSGTSGHHPLVPGGHTHKAPTYKAKEKATNPEATTPLDMAKIYATTSFLTLKGQNPAWGKADDAQLSGLFGRKRDLTLQEFQRRWDNYARSTDSFIASQGLSLRFFCSQFDRFLDGPVCKSNPDVRIRKRIEHPDYSALEGE
jgi:hypothetical protein